MARNAHMINLSEMTWDEIQSPAGSRFGGQRKRVGIKIGAEKLGYSFFKVAAGKTAFPYHAHTGNEEMIYIIAGSGVLRFGEEELPCRARTSSLVRRVRTIRTSSSTPERPI